MSKDSAKFWLPLIIPSITSLMVMYYGGVMQEEKETDQKMLQEVQSISKEMHETNVTFKGIQVEVKHLSEGQKKMEQRINMIEERIRR